VNGQALKIISWLLEIMLCWMASLEDYFMITGIYAWLNGYVKKINLRINGIITQCKID
jgi:hypothetical protein